MDVAYNSIANKRLAELMTLDSDLWIFRRFDRLSLFNILHLQQHLAELERRLDQAVPEKASKFNKHEFDLVMPEIESSLAKYGMSEKPSLCLTQGLIASRGCTCRASQT